MAINLKETITRREQIEEITYDEFSDNLVFEKIASDLNDPQYYFETGKTVEFSAALRELLEKYQDLKKENPDLYKRYQALLTLLELYGIPGFGPNKLAEIFQNHLIFAATHNIDLIDRINSLYLTYNFYPASIRPLRNVILNAMRDNEEILGKKNIILNGAKTKPYVGAWLLDYQLFGEEGPRHTPVDQSNYVMRSQNSQTLDEKEKLILLKLIQIYDYVLIPLLKKDYRPFEVEFHPDRHVESFIPEEETGGADTSLGELSAEPIEEGLRLTYGGEEITITTGDTAEEKMKEKMEGRPKERTAEVEMKEKAIVKAKDEKAVYEESATEQIQGKIRMKNNLFREDEKEIYESEKGILDLSGDDNNKIKGITLNAYMDKEASKFFAGLFLLSRAGEMKNLVKEKKVKDMFRQEIFPLLQKQNESSSMEDMAKNLKQNPDDPVYTKIFLKYAFNKILSGEEEKAAFIATRLENIFSARGEEEYLGLAFYNISTDKYEWANAKVQENGKLEME